MISLIYQTYNNIGACVSVCIHNLVSDFKYLYTTVLYAGRKRIHPGNLS